MSAEEDKLDVATAIFPSKWCSPTVLIPKKKKLKKGIPLWLHFCKINAVSKFDLYPELMI